MYAGKWIAWIPNNRYPEVDTRYRQVLTESRDIRDLCFWKIRLEKVITNGA